MMDNDLNLIKKCNDLNINIFLECAKKVKISSLEKELVIDNLLFDNFSKENELRLFNKKGYTYIINTENLIDTIDDYSELKEMKLQNNDYTYVTIEILEKDEEYCKNLDIEEFIALKLYKEDLKFRKELEEIINDGCCSCDKAEYLVEEIDNHIFDCDVEFAYEGDIIDDYEPKGLEITVYQGIGNIEVGKYEIGIV